METATVSQVSSVLGDVLPALERLRDGLLPPTCLACETPIDRQGQLCASCWRDMRFIQPPFCAVLGTPFSYDIGAGALSAEAIANPPPFDAARSAVLYDAVARRLVQGFKFADRVDLAPWLAAMMGRASDGLLDENALVIPVPLHRRRLFMRRYNQSAELARHIARHHDCRYRPDLLIRSRATRQQIGLQRKERDRNVRGAFRVPKGRAIELKGARVVLVDDVYTTGATLKACTRTLRRAGAAWIGCLTFARVAPGDL